MCLLSAFATGLERLPSAGTGPLLVLGDLRERQEHAGVGAGYGHRTVQLCGAGAFSPSALSAGLQHRLGTEAQSACPA